MEKEIVLLLFVLVASLQLITSDAADAESTNVGDFSRCKNIRIKELHVDDIVCVKVAFERSEIGIDVTITWNGKKVFGTKVLVQRPPPLCFRIPFIKSLKACLKLTHVAFKPHHHGACMVLELKTCMIYRKFKLGCIYRELKDKDKDRNNPLEIYEHVRTLVNVDNIEKSSTEKHGGLQSSDQSATEVIKKLFGLDSSDSLNVDKEVADEIIRDCVCFKHRQCICCKSITLFHRARTRVCGKVIITKEGKGIWVSLMVDEAKYFRLYTPVSRRFKFACALAEIRCVRTVVCLHLEKVMKTKKGINLCLSAVIYMRSSKQRRYLLGCVNSKVNFEQQSDDLAVKFKPFNIVF